MIGAVLYYIILLGALCGVASKGIIGVELLTNM